jgi:hypothetical protein
MADQHEASAAIERIISESFQKARTDLAADLERTQVLRDHAQVKEIIEYGDRLETTATFSTPRAREFLNLIQQMDQLLMWYDTLWLAGFAETDERVHRSQNWQRRLIKITNRLRELANRTRVSLSRQSRPGEVASGAGDASGEEGAAVTPASSEALVEGREEGADLPSELEEGAEELDADSLSGDSSDLDLEIERRAIQDPLPTSVGTQTPAPAVGRGALTEVSSTSQSLNGREAGAGSRKAAVTVS